VLPTTTEAVVSAEHVAAIHATVEAFVEERGLNGAGLVIVDREAGIVHEDYWGEFGPDRISFIASSSKMITAGVLMRLHEDGLLDVDVPVAQQVGWTGNPEITPAQLVSNSSGLVALSREPDYAPYGCMFDPGDDLEECGRAIFETPDDDGDVIPPDTEFRYGGGQWQVAGALAEAVSGRSWSELLDEIYIGPCGVGSLGYDNQFALTSGLEYPVGHDPVELPPTDNPNMEGGAFITARDYGTLLLMHLREGRCSDGRALSAASVDRLHADRTITAYEDGATAPGYAMGWGVDRSTGRLADPGAYGSVALLDPAAGYGAYLVIEADGTTGGELWQLIATEIDGAMSG
jgi:CubicO group peptidase (beta-lactamase class C family)